MKKTLILLIAFIVLLSSCGEDGNNKNLNEQTNTNSQAIHPVEAFGGLKLGDTEENFQNQLDANPIIISKSGTFRGGSHIIKLDDEYYGDIIYWTKGNIVISIALNIYSINGSECLDTRIYYKALKLLNEKFESDIEKLAIENQQKGGLQSMHIEKGFYWFSATAFKNFENDVNNSGIEKGCGKIQVHWAINENALENKKQENINKNF